MCKATLYKEKCGHLWLELVQPCYWGYDLTNCPIFQPKATSVTTRMPPLLTVQADDAHPCLLCSLHGVYDRRYRKLVLNNKFGMRWGTSPVPGWGSGIDLPCLLM
jgi:hypothetical protein